MKRQALGGGADGARAAGGGRRRRADADAALRHAAPHRARGRAVQVDPMKPTLKAPGSEHSKLKSDDLLSNFAFNFNLRRYIEAVAFGSFLRWGDE